MFASNRRLKLKSFTSHSSSNFALQINVIFAFLVLSQTLPFEHLLPKSPSPRPFLLDRLGVQYGIRLLPKSWLVYWQELYCDRLKRGCKEKKHGPPHTMDLVPGPRGQVGVRAH